MRFTEREESSCIFLASFGTRRGIKYGVKPTIRPARLTDAEAMRTIYNHAARTSTATMDTEGRDLDAQTLWMNAHNGDPYPALVAVDDDGTVLGWASLSPYNPKPGYRTTAENSVYVAESARGNGVGEALLLGLLQAAQAGGFVCIIALITADNTASLRLHEKHGFITVGTLRKVGRKFDQWVDVTTLQKLLD